MFVGSISEYEPKILTKRIDEESGSLQVKKARNSPVTHSTFEYRMKISKFTGVRDEDYDIWWVNLQVILHKRNYNNL